ncbi:hypothetical protein EDM76_11545 [bacterium]|nr:MAG: hypothetical protein EDM76_11545 [bacterium]
MRRVELVEQRERRRHVEEMRANLAREWETLEFDALQPALREVIDRIEVDGEDLALFLRM